MNASIKYFLSDKIMFLGFSFSIIVIFIHALLFGILYQYFPPFVPIYNQMPWGIERIGTKSQLFTPLFVTILIFLGNIFFSSYIYGKMPLIARILCVTSLLASLFGLLFFVRLMQIIL